ncbi:MAG TPA: hypothetical protein VJQ57_13830 [Acidimicrobiia bacterium]|nr:hypothetical protein [Acidimicrobiia bacterium]
MICNPCAAAADNRVRDTTRCAACKREVLVYGNTKRSYRIMVHKVANPDGGPRVKCPGSTKAPLVTGHDACTGCDCQHHPVGTRQKGK